MPFIEKSQREKIGEAGFGEADTVGDLCFIVYDEMMKRWNARPRWTTIHYIKKEFVTQPCYSEFLKKIASDLGIKYGIQTIGGDNSDHKFDEDDIATAASLAFDVFMFFHGIEYEKDKQKINGDIL